ncbi:class IV adenylate cyclase [Glycomyces arizonensis]|uniref:class IV adenylate cyclase n=1 Tax=Glycomyces arizonensis TaxID=256035 RepID=UPI00047987B2|nr:CYTH domain-containing protein [Glycomyces arizonensis]
MIEAELKARVCDVEAVQRWLRERATEEPATYYDTYYDWPDHRLDTDGREIRLRTIETATGARHFLTYKQPPADAKSGSKPEHETTIIDRDPVVTMFHDLGLVELVSLTKYCQNYKFIYDNRLILATLVSVPELDGTFLEVEVAAESDNFEGALAVVRTVIAELELSKELDFTAYTDGVRKARLGRGD